MKDFLRLLRLFGGILALGPGRGSGFRSGHPRQCRAARSGRLVHRGDGAGRPRHARRSTISLPAAAIRGLAVLRTGGRYLERLITHEATLRLLARLARLVL